MGSASSKELKKISRKRNAVDTTKTNKNASDDQNDQTWSNGLSRDSKMKNDAILKTKLEKGVEIITGDCYK